VTAPAVDAQRVSRSFGRRTALEAVSFSIAPGEIHALLGPNGAGKTTLLRILGGLIEPTEGAVRVLGRDAAGSTRMHRSAIGLVPSGDRTFYLRISGLENLAFFARLHGFRRREAVGRAREALGSVGLAEAAGVPVGEYSHGMQKRLSVARALLTDPPVLLVDEATHDLDPEGARLVRSLVGGIASRGTAVAWATQRIDEIRGFAHRVTLLHRHRVQFSGSVPALLAQAVNRRHLVRLANGTGPVEPITVSRAVGRLASATPAASGEPEHYLLSLADGTVLGDALAALAAAGIKILSCREERSELEEAFLNLTRSR
jgi:ABC-2 type transport system ATP-binding protein